MARLRSIVLVLGYTLLVAWLGENQPASADEEQAKEANTSKEVHS